MRCRALMGLVPQAMPTIVVQSRAMAPPAMPDCRRQMYGSNLIPAWAAAPTTLASVVAAAAAVAAVVVVAAVCVRAGLVQPRWLP